ncbi:MAG: hypothetical protein RH949_13095 [Coleofasciculus sp. A1-SPW-01]|uniref:hypothetical protein n=1 Tax=Coleofasciculus sp. A1-SPW-01 TaxID=3070819 RepID=UPI0032FAC2E3
MAETYNPILSTENLGRRGLLQRPPILEPGVALVCSGNGKPLLTLLQGQKTLTWGEACWGYNKLYRVDMTEHPLDFQCDVPCKGDAFKFHAEITFRCSVRDPEVIVNRNVTDVAQWIKSSVEEMMRIISRKYDVKESGNAEIEMRGTVNKAIYESGFNLSNFTLKLSLQQEVADWIRSQTRIQEEIQLEKSKQYLIIEKTQFEIEQEEKKAELEQKRIERQQELENKLRLKKLQAKLQHQELEQRLAQQQADFELKIMEQKTKFYSSMLQSGNLQLLALQLAQNPEDVRAILQALNQQKQIEREHNIKILRTLLDADVVEGWQLTEVGKRALQELIGVNEMPQPVLQDSEATSSERQEDSSVAAEVSLDSQSNISSEPIWEDNEE